MNFKKLNLHRSSPVLSLAYSSTLQVLAVGQMGDTQRKPSLSLWDPSGKKPIHLLEEEPYSSISSMSFDQTGQRLIYSINSNIYSVDVDSGLKEQLSVSGTHTRINQIVSSRVASRIALSGQHTSVYETGSEKTLWTLEGYEGFALTQDLRIPELPHEWKTKLDASSFKNEPAVVALSDDGNHLFVGGHNKGKIEKIDINKKVVVEEISSAPLQAYAMSLGCDEEVLATASKIPYANFLWDLKSGGRILPELFNERFGAYSSLCLHPSKRWLASGTLVGFVSLQNLEDGAFIFSEQLHEGRAGQVIFGGNSKTMFSAGHDGAVHIIEP